jgi:hypothetical protein
VSAQVRAVTLNNGVEMPILGFGVFQIPAEQTEQAVASALGRRLPAPRYTAASDVPATPG